ncbi:MAG: dipeptidase [Ferruginibacter sp.]|nr:dipeptidase [Ferruginibacter sp.]
MRLIILIIGIFLTQQTNAQSYKKIHNKAIVIDTHNDFLMQVTDSASVAYRNNEFALDKDLKGKTHIDLKRQKEGGLDVQVFSIFCTGDMKTPFSFANRQIDSLDAVIARNPNKIVKAVNSSDILKAVKQHKLIAMLGVEGGHMIEDDLNKLDFLFKRGARYMTLTWNNSTSWATSAYEETFKKDLTHKGLTDFGKQVVNRMNELGIIVDISHVGEQTFWDVIKTTTKPIIASHSSVYNLCNHQRNLKDDQIKAIAKNGGVIQVNFNPPFIDSSFAKKENIFFQKHKIETDSLVKSGMDGWVMENYLYSKYKDEANAMRPPLSVLIQHIEYIINLVGVDYIGLGSDFDGINITPQQLDDVTNFPLITKALVDKGYTKKDITKILGGNFLRVLKANEKTND